MIILKCNFDFVLFSKNKKKRKYKNKKTCLTDIYYNSENYKEMFVSL